MNEKNELLAVVIDLESLGDGQLPATNGSLVHGAFLKMVASFSSALSGALHNENGEKPFTLSNLRTDNKTRRKSIRGAPTPQTHSVVAGDRCRIRIASLNAALGTQLLDVIDSAKGSFMRIGHIPFRVADRDAVTHQRAGSVSYEGLMEACRDAGASPAPWFGWSFLSATAIHSHGRNLAFPEAAAIFPSLVGRWNKFCPPSCRLPYENNKAFHDLVERTLMTSANSFTTHMLDFGAKGKELAFTGSIEFQPVKFADPELLKSLAMLGKFSFFSGIGYGTTKGLGQVDFLLP
jgi:CRISPR-associated endoribonuclease Cas6